MKCMNAEYAKERNVKRELQLGIIEDVELWMSDYGQFKLVFSDGELSVSESQLGAALKMFEFYVSQRSAMDERFKALNDGSLDEYIKKASSESTAESKEE